MNMTQLIQIWKDIYTFLGHDVTAGLIGLVVFLVFIPLNVVLMVWSEMKVFAHITLRPAFMEVGPHGILQNLADAVKMLGKDVITPKLADKFLFAIAPIIIFVPCFVGFVIIPFSQVMQVKDLNVGILLIFSFSSLSVFSILMAGWASNNKYSLIGAVRAVAQNVAYEIPLLLSTMSVIIMTNSFRMSDIVTTPMPLWHWIFIKPIAFLIFFISTTAETNRAPFDLVEAESELVAGFHTEYTGMRFGMFFMAEYTNMFIAASMATVLFLGGWRGPILPGVIWFLIKVSFLIFVVYWIRWTFPRVRFDQLMNFAWKVLIPISLVTLMITAILVKVL